MKQVRGVWLPDSEKHLEEYVAGGPEFAGAGTYQLHKFLAAMPHIKNFRHAVDIGAHCGLWSRVMARCFASLTAFEPIELHRTCLLANVPGHGRLLHHIPDTNDCRFTVHPVALGNAAGEVSIRTKAKSTGDAHVIVNGEPGDDVVTAKLRTLDSYGLTRVDFIKIDCEGYELFVIRGGEKTIRRDRPTIVVEQKPNKGAMYGIGDRDAMMLLLEWGAELKWEHGGDCCLRWKN